MSFGLLKTLADKIMVLEAAATRYGVLEADYTLTSTTSTQRLFNWSASGALTITSGIYHFDTLLHVTTMDATSGNAGFAVRGAGTATLTRVLYQTAGTDTATPTGAGTLSGLISTAQASAVAMVAATVNTNMTVRISGMFECTATGTIIPSITLANAAAAVVKIGSFFRCTRIGNAGAFTGGNWS